MKIHYYGKSLLLRGGVFDLRAPGLEACVWYTGQYRLIHLASLRGCYWPSLTCNVHKRGLKLHLSI